MSFMKKPSLSSLALLLYFTMFLHLGDDLSLYNAGYVASIEALRSIIHVHVHIHVHVYAWCDVLEVLGMSLLAHATVG